MSASSGYSPREDSARDNRSGYRCAGSDGLPERLLNALQTGIIFFDRNGVILRVNLEARKNLQMEEELVGRNITEILGIINHDKNILPDLLAEFECSGVEEVRLPNNTFIQSEIGLVRFFAKGLFTRLDDGEFILSFRNIVDELTQEYMLKMALSSTRIFPWYYDMVRNVMVIDSRYFAYTGIPTKDYTLSLDEFSARVHPSDQEKMANAFALQLHGEHFPYPVEFRLLRGDGKYEWFEGQSTYLGQVDGLPFRVVGICMSTQTHKEIEESLILARDKAEQSDRLKSAFLANMSHEIRTPLNAIVGFSTLLTDGGMDLEGQDAKEYAELIRTNCDNLLALISDIIDLSRIETDTLEYRFSLQTLDSFFTDIYRNNKFLISEEVVFNMQLPKESVQVETDPLRLRQIFDSLLGNAVKFTNRGYINFGYQLSEDGESAELFVEDSGCGIPEDELEKIFERFYKVDDFVRGVGLGLSISKTIAERLGGVISVSSCLNKGSRFVLKLPLRR